MEYPKIETLYERDPVTFKVRPGVFKNSVYRLITEWQFTEKIDGTNIRCLWEDGQLSFGGRTANASIPADLITWLYTTSTRSTWRRPTPRPMSTKPMP